MWDQVQSSTGHIRQFLSTFVLLWFVMVCFHNEAHWIPLCSGPFLNRYLGGFADAQKGIAQSLESSSHVASFVRPSLKDDPSLGNVPLQPRMKTSWRRPRRRAIAKCVLGGVLTGSPVQMSQKPSSVLFSFKWWSFHLFPGGLMMSDVSDV